MSRYHGACEMYSAIYGEKVQHITKKPARTWNMGIDGFALLIESGRSCTSLPGCIQVLLSAKFFARELSDGYSINIRAIPIKTN